MNYKIPEGAKEISVTETEGKIVVEFITPPMFKEGDVVCEDGRIMIVKAYPSYHHANTYPKTGGLEIDGEYGLPFTTPTFRLATEEEKKQLFSALKKEGKKWNAEKMCVEDIAERGKIEDYLSSLYLCTRTYAVWEIANFIESYIKQRGE